MAKSVRLATWNANPASWKLSPTVRFVSFWAATDASPPPAPWNEVSDCFLMQGKEQRPTLERKRNDVATYENICVVLGRQPRDFGSEE